MNVRSGAIVSLMLGVGPFCCPSARGEALVVGMRGESGSDVLKLDGDTLGTVAAFEKDFWGPIASVLGLPDGNFVVIEKTSHGCAPRFRSGGGTGSGKASVCLVDGSDFSGFGYREVAAKTFYSGTPNYEAFDTDGSLGGIVNRFGEICLNQNSAGNFDGMGLFDGADGALSRLHGEMGTTAGAFNPPSAGVVGVALASGDWVVAGYEPLGPDQMMATLEFRARTNIRDRPAGHSMFRTDVQRDPPTAVGINKNDKIALGVQSGTIRQLSFDGSSFVVEGTRSSTNLAGGAVIAIGALSDGNWVVAANAGGESPGRIWILKEGSLSPLSGLPDLPQLSAMGIRGNDDVVIGTESGRILVYDPALKSLKKAAGGFNPITHITVLAAEGKPSKTARVGKEPMSDVERNAAWSNALQPKGKPGRTITLADDGKTDYVILCPAAPTSQEEKAAMELASWLNKITGATFPILRECSEKGQYALLGIGKEIRAQIEPGKFISVGSTALMSGAGLEDRRSDLAGEGYCIAVKDGNLYLMGGNRRGIINAAFALLEEDLGCRWYSASTATFPRFPTLRFKPVARTYAPVLVDRRDPYYTEAQDVEWSLRNRTLGIGIPIPPAWGGYPKPLGMTGFVHSFHNIVPPSEFFAGYPEYFMLENGQRVPRQLCLTNPGVLRIATDRIRAGLVADPDARIVDVSPVDGGGICQCDNCRAVNEREESGMGTLLAFVNGIADAIKDEHPEVRVTTLAYLDTVLPPKTLRPRDNVLLWLCTDSHAWEHLLQFAWETDREGIQKPGHIDLFDKALLGWHAIGAKMVIWDYPIDYHNYILPLPNMPVVTESMRYYAKHGATGVFQQAQDHQTYGVDRSLMRSWVWAKQMWDLSRDTRALVRDFNYGFYGKAAEPMQEYDDLLWGTWETLHKDLVKLREYEKKFGPGVGGAFLTPAFVARAAGLFAEAERLAAGDPALLDRVKLATLPILYVQIEAGPGSDTAGYLKKIEEFAVIARKNGVTNVRSGLRGPLLDELLQIWRALATETK